MSTALRVVVFGSTGTAGSEAVRQCLADPRIVEVRAVTRRATGAQHTKLREIICDDFDALPGMEDTFTGIDACFFCLGISQSQAQSEDHYRQITVVYPLSAARALRERSPEHTFHYLSGQGADPSGKSLFMWARVKGEAENTLRDMDLRRLFIHRPGYIHPERAFARPGVGAAMGRALFPVMRAIAPGSAIRAVELGRAMIEATLSDSPGGLLENRDIRAFAERAPAATAEER